MSKVGIKPPNKTIVKVSLRSTSILVQHAWSQKAKTMIAEKQGGRKTKDREARDPESEAKEATYCDSGGNCGLPAMALKRSLIDSAHKDLGIEKTLVRKSLFIVCPDPSLVIPFTDCAEPIVRSDMVRVGMGSSDIRYRPQFDWWKCEVTFEIDADMLRPDDLATLVTRAGFGIGLCEYRPQKNGDWGRFEIDPDVPMQIGK